MIGLATPFKFIKTYPKLKVKENEQQKNNNISSIEIDKIPRTFMSISEIGIEAFENYKTTMRMFLE